MKFGRRPARHHHHHKVRRRPAAPTLVSMEAFFTQDVLSSVVIALVLPPARANGRALALSDIASLTLLRDIGDGSGPKGFDPVLGPFSAPTINLKDMSPVNGDDTYSFFVTDTNTLRGKTSLPVSVQDQ
jgi:hypothetical protein